jgi:DnaJ-class molecular chaperone
MAKSYFAILGVTTGASSDEIKSAYRRLAKEFHPDRQEGDGSAFRQIQEAYSVLGDNRRRDEYVRHLAKPARREQAGAADGPAPEPLIPEPRQVDLGEISPIRSFHTFAPSFDEVFEWVWNNFSSSDRPKSGRVQSLTLEVPLTRQQVRAGGTTRIMVPAQAACPVCRGYGGLGFYPCVRCSGEGAISGEVPVSIAFPPCLANDYAVVIPLERFGIHNLHLTVLFRPMDDEG